MPGRSTQIKPNFFIVGAPKCGTTAMYEYLKAHPDIYMPERKEPHFFGADLLFTERHNVIREPDRYLALYANWQGERAVGDPSVWYLYSQKAACEIKDFAPDAAIIIMLRNPVDMIYSVYHQSRYDGNEDLPTFEEALGAEHARKQGEQIPKTALFPQGLYYSEIALFSQQVQRYLDVFGKAQVHIILFDDFTRNTAQVYRDTLNFLGVDPDFAIDFNIINSNKQVRSATARNLARGLSMRYRRVLNQWDVDPNDPTRYEKLAARNFWQRNLIRILLKLAGFANRGVKSLNTQYIGRPPMPDSLRAELVEHFAADIESLSEIIGRDLSHWTQTRSEQG